MAKDLPEPEPVGPAFVKRTPPDQWPTYEPDPPAWPRVETAVAPPIDPHARKTVEVPLVEQLLAAPANLVVHPAGPGSVEPLVVVALMAQRIGVFSCEANKQLPVRPDADLMMKSGWVFMRAETAVLPVAIVGGKLTVIPPGEGRVEVVPQAAGLKAGR